MSTKITAPQATVGPVDMHFGQGTIQFVDGVAEVDFEINDGLKAYLRANGYGVGSREAKAPEDTTPQVPDPRDNEITLSGTPLRDAAVDPKPEDFLPPVNAGAENPHGPLVVAPGIHGTGPGPIVPGTVGSHAYQQAKESDTAQAILVEGLPAPEVTAALNGVARAEYELTKATGKDRGMAQELQGAPSPENYTAEERELLGLDDIGEPSTGDPAPDPDPIPDPVDEVLKGQALHDALVDAGLPTGGTADEKRQRLAEAQV